MLQAPIFWGVLCGGLYFLVMWWVRSRRLTQQRQSTKALYRLSEEIVAAMSAEGIAAKLEERLPGLTDSSAVYLHLANRDAKLLSRVATPAHPDPLNTSLENPAKGLANALALCYRNRTILAIPDTRDNALAKGSQESMARSLLLVPLVSHEEALGVLHVERADRPGPFSIEHQSAAQHVGNQVASALKLQEQHLLREQLFRGEKLAATGHMISGIAGELIAPIEAISALSENLGAVLKRRDDLPTVEAGLARVAAEASRAREVMGRMLSFSQDGAAPARQLDLTGVLQKLTRHRQSVWDDQGLRAQVKLGGSLPVVGVDAQLEQIFLTFLLHVEKKARNTELREVLLKSFENTHGAHVEIGYAAPGSADDEPEEALGIGSDGGLSLDVCRTLLAAHGGELKLHRRPGIFAFEVRLPAVGRANEAPVAPPARATRALTVMLVDPEPGTSRPLLKLLSSRGHRVVPVAGEEAAEMAPRMRFDAVFWPARPGRGDWGDSLERVRTAIASFVLVSDGYDRELASSLEKNGGYLLAQPVEEGALDRVLSAIDVRVRNS